MIPWKFHKDWLNTDLENWFWKFWKKYRFLKKYKKNSAQKWKSDNLFLYFLKTSVLRNAGWVRLSNFVKKCENHYTLLPNVSIQTHVSGLWSHVSEHFPTQFGLARITHGIQPNPLFQLQHDLSTDASPHMGRLIQGLSDTKNTILYNMTLQELYNTKFNL